jgi:copper chaperone
MIKLRIRGMSCDHCVRAVTQALGAIPGVQRVVEVSLDRGEAVLEGEVDPASLVAAVEEEGFKAEVSR